MAVLRRRTEAYSDAQFGEYLEAEAEAVRALYVQGAVRSAWSRGDALGGVLLLEAGSVESARDILAMLPLVQREMAEIENVIPLRGYRGFGPRQA